MKRRKLDADQEEENSMKEENNNTLSRFLLSIDDILPEELLAEVVMYVGSSHSHSHRDNDDDRESCITSAVSSSSLSHVSSLAQCSSQWRSRINSNALFWKSIVARHFKQRISALSATPRLAPHHEHSPPLLLHLNNPPITPWKMAAQLVIQHQQHQQRNHHHGQSNTNSMNPLLFNSELNQDGCSSAIRAVAPHGHGPHSSGGVLCFHAHYTGANQSNHAAKLSEPLTVPLPHSQSSSVRRAEEVCSSWITLERRSPSEQEEPVLLDAVERSIRYLEVSIGFRPLSDTESIQCGDSVAFSSASPSASAYRRRAILRIKAKRKRESDTSQTPGSRRGVRALEEECVAVGVATSEFPASRQMPGWSVDSIGYHSDDGALFINGQIVRKDLPRFSTGDVVGIGFVPHLHALFYTLNGRFLCVAAVNIDSWLFPTIGLDSDDQIQISTGGAPFAFNIDSIDPLWNQKAENLLRFECERSFDWADSKRADFFFSAVPPQLALLLADQHLYGGADGLWANSSDDSDEEMEQDDDSDELGDYSGDVDGDSFDFPDADAVHHRVFHPMGNGRSDLHYYSDGHVSDNDEVGSTRHSGDKDEPHSI